MYSLWQSKSSACTLCQSLLIFLKDNDMSTNIRRKIIKISLLLKDIGSDPYYFQVGDESHDPGEIKEKILEKYHTNHGTLECLLEGERLILTWVPDQIHDDAEKYHRDAIVSIKNKMYDEAIDKWQHAIQLNGSDAEYPYKLGLIYFEQKDYLASIEFLEKATLICPIHYKALLLLGINYIKIRKFEIAKNYIIESQRLDKTNILSYLNLGAIYSVQKQFNDVIEMFNTARQLNPNEPRAYLGLARVYHMLTDFDAANRNFKKVIELAPGTTMAEYAKRSIQIPEKENRLVVDVKKNRDMYISKGMIHFILNDYANAAKNYKEYLALQPKDDYVWFLLGETNLRLELVTEAASCFKRAIRINDKRANYYKALGIAFNFLGKPDETIEVIKHFFKLAKKDTLSETILAINYLRLKKYSDAIPFLQKAIERNTNNFLARYYLAVTYVKEKNISAAQKETKYILSQKNDFPLKIKARKLQKTISENL